MAVVRLGNLLYKYEKEDLKIENLPEITHDDAKEILFVTKKICAEFGLKVYLAFGTLLGAVRDKDFIKGDLDVDVYVKDEELLFSHLDYLEKKGLSLIRVVKHNTYSFRYKNNPKCYIDLYIARDAFNIWSLYCSEICGLATPKKFLDDGKIEFLGEVFDCPKNPEEILEFWYTSSWNVPLDKSESEKYLYTVPSFYYYRIIKRNLKAIVKYLIGWRYWRSLIRKDE